MTAGGVAMGSSANFRLSPHQPVLLGALAGAASVLGYK
jgi:hypothetical protein